MQLGELGYHFARARPGDPRGRKQERRERRLEHRNGTVQQVGTRESLSHNVASLHQFQREFERVGVVQAAAQHHRMVHETIALGAACDVEFERERSTSPLRQARQVVQLDARSQRISDQIEQQQLTGVCLGGRDRLLASGMHQKHMSGNARQRAGGVIGDPDRAGALVVGAFQHQIRVGGFAGLRNRDHQHALEVKLRPVQREDGWSRESHRDAGGDFEQIAPELRGVVGGAARGQHDEARRIAPQDGAQFLDRSAIGLERPFEHGRLLVDIVSHF